MSNHFLPADKGDVEALQRLQALPIEQQRPLASSILDCMQDGNWPIYRPARSILQNFVQDLSGDILAVLQDKDGVWSRNVIVGLLQQVPTAVTPQLRQELERIVATPTRQEMDEDVVEAAKELLAMIDNNQS